MLGRWKSETYYVSELTIPPKVYVFAPTHTGEEGENYRLKIREYVINGKSITVKIAKHQELVNAKGRPIKSTVSGLDATYDVIDRNTVNHQVVIFGRTVKMHRLK